MAVKGVTHKRIKVYCQLMRTKTKMIRMMSEMSGQDPEKVKQDCERDYFMTAQEALDYGIIDEIFDPRQKK